jgi:ankyrin repeat protein
MTINFIHVNIFDDLDNLFVQLRCLTLPCSDGSTPLHSSAEGGHTQVVKLLVRGKADVGARDR